MKIGNNLHIQSVRPTQKDNIINPGIGFIILGFFYIAWCISPVAREWEGTMMWYFSIITFSALFALLAQTIKDANFSKFLLLISLSVIWLPFAFRGIMGTDDDVYRNIFYNVGRDGFIKTFFSSTMEPGYLLLNQIGGLFTDNYFFTEILCATIPFVAFYTFLLKSHNIVYYFVAVLYITCCLYFNVLEAAVVRIFIAIFIVLYGFRFLLKGDLKKYVVTILIAMTFHYSAGVMLLFTLLLWNNRYFASHPLKGTLILVGLFALMFAFVSFMALNVMGARYMQYVQPDDSTTGEGISIMTFDTLPFVIWGILFRKSIPKSEYKAYNTLLIVLFMGSIVSVLSALLPLGRLIFYLNCSIIFLVSYWYRYSRGLMRIGIISVFVFYCYLYAFMTKLSFTDNNLYPYIGIWS